LQDLVYGYRAGVYSCTMAPTLPEELTRGADLRDGEYAWSIESFRDAIALAPISGFACLGGQFQLRPGPDTVYEMYWVEANASERFPSESWKSYATRSCSEVSEQFNSLLRKVNFSHEAVKFASLDSSLATGRDVTECLVFNAYFVNEPEFELLNRKGVEI
jgi:hypothetical protein